MKKLAIALAAVAALTAPAFAADMPVRTPVTAPVAYAPSWTGCYVGGGGGYGLWNQENTGFIDGPPRVPFTATTTAGGRGYLGTVGGGCDYQFPVGGWNFIVGAFADYDWSSIKGKLNPPAAIGLVGDEKESSAWAVGGRVGWLAFPSLLTFHGWLYPSDLRSHQPQCCLRTSLFPGGSPGECPHRQKNL
jgi:outer membrane immunogenic protein